MPDTIIVYECEKCHQRWLTRPSAVHPDLRTWMPRLYCDGGTVVELTYVVAGPTGVDSA
jgi:hypothetical protein